DAAGSLSVLTDLLAPYAAGNGNTAVQFTEAGITLAQPNGRRVCSGLAPTTLGEWFELQITRAGGVLAVEIDDVLVASVAASTAGGTIALGGYRADGRFGAVSIAALDAVPAGHPTAATGCHWAPHVVEGVPFTEGFADGIDGWTSVGTSSREV